MYLIFPESMIVPEVADRREDDDFEDWLTAVVIENANHEQPNGIEPSARGITDLWMLEIPERTGKVWRGRFQVEFNQEDELPPKNGNTLEQEAEVVAFSLNPDTGEMRFAPKISALVSKQDFGKLSQVGLTRKKG
jgi:hypothetical protein